MWRSEFSSFIRPGFMGACMNTGMTFFDLCAGVGGFSLGLERAGMTCAGHVEINAYCRAVLQKHWPGLPCWEDIRDERTYKEYPKVDLVCAGYPCQPFSLARAGERRGGEDDRHLWPFVFKIIKRLKPTWCLFENVVGHISLGLDDVLSDLEAENYACWPLVIPACAVQAEHIRSRVWVIAHAGSNRLARHALSGYYQVKKECSFNAPNKANLYFTAKRILGQRDSSSIRRGDGVPNGVDRITALGNAVHPDVVEIIGRSIIKAQNC